MAQVLLVQGDLELGELLGHVLRRAGYAVALAGDAAAGLRLLAGAPIDLVLVGPWLPDLAVEEFCRRARAQTPAPVAALGRPATGHAHNRAAGGAADAYLPLPLSPQALLSQLGTLLTHPHRR